MMPTGRRLSEHLEGAFKGKRNKLRPHSQLKPPGPRILATMNSHFPACENLTVNININVHLEDVSQLPSSQSADVINYLTQAVGQQGFYGNAQGANPA